MLEFLKTVQFREEVTNLSETASTALIATKQANASNRRLFEAMISFLETRRVETFYEINLERWANSEKFSQLPLKRTHFEF
jgi:hypothetical protein